MLRDPGTVPQSGVDMRAALVLGLAVLAVTGAVGVVHAQEWPQEDNSKYATLRMGVNIVNATLYEGGDGRELVMWLDLKPGPYPDNAFSIRGIKTSEPDFWLPDYCVQYKRDEALVLTKPTLLKSCYYVPHHLDTADLLSLHVGYNLTRGSYHYIFGKVVSLSGVDFQQIELSPVKDDTQPQPMMCEVPTTADIQDRETPRLLTAAYHTLFGDLILSFDESATLADGWQDNITIGDVPVGERTTNRMVSASSLAWLSLDYRTQSELSDIDTLAVTIEAGTFLDADGNPNDRITMQAAIVG